MTEARTRGPFRLVFESVLAIATPCLGLVTLVSLVSGVNWFIVAGGVYFTISAVLVTASMFDNADRRPLSFAILFFLWPVVLAAAVAWLLFVYDTNKVSYHFIHRYGMKPAQ